jgi:hypothetical protein
MASLGGEVVSDCRRSDDGKPEVIHPDEKKSKFGQRLIAWLHVRNRIFALARAVGATPEALYFLLQPFAASRDR